LSRSPAGHLAACSPRVVAEVIDRVPAPTIIEPNRRQTLACRCWPVDQCGRDCRSLPQGVSAGNIGRDVACRKTPVFGRHDILPGWYRPLARHVSGSFAINDPPVMVNDGGRRVADEGGYPPGLTAAMLLGTPCRANSHVPHGRDLV
jgi:hypothetical protein